MNFSRDVVDAAPSGRLALVVLSHEGQRADITFAEVADRSARLAGALTALDHWIEVQRGGGLAQAA